MALLRSLLKPLVPKRLLSAYRAYNLARSHRRTEAMTTAEVFTDIYANNRWGGARGTFCSGTGSAAASIAAPYVACIRDQLSKLGAERLTAVDLGCGDFSIGQQLAGDCGRYVGVDIVASLVRHNTQSFGTSRISFQSLDIIEDSLPDGDICFLRQVLQHLSNEQIGAILPKLERYRWTFITEHQPSASRLAQRNLDKPHGGDIRVQRGSGVFLDHPPFNIPTERLELLLEVAGSTNSQALDPETQDPGVIRTFVLRPGNSDRPAVLTSSPEQPQTVAC